MLNHGRSLRISLVAALLGGACVAGATSAAISTTAASTFTAVGSARQVYVTGMTPGARAALLDAAGHQVAARAASALGGLLFRNVTPGTGYQVRVLPSGPTSAPLTVHSEAPDQWNPDIYKQSIPDDGYGYLTTRDGTKLAYNVWPPTKPAGLGTPDVTLPAGPDYAPPYPTLIEYSGYGYANPDGPESGIAAVANTMGFAVVDVNMRGTGCSGGAFDFFEPLQSLDGYDVVETIARQPWVKDNKVGMMGISYGGISQLFTAQTRPPSLEAIAPLSVIDATATTLYPGGIRNDGFAVAWAKERQQNAEAATGPNNGQQWVYKKIQAGDQVCKDNQVLHPEAADLMTKIRQNSHYVPKVADPLDPVTFVNKINVPVFMACQFEDEQTGGHCPTLAEHMTGTTKKWFTFTNGPHIDSLDPETYNRWYDFLSLYVAHQPPAENAAVMAAAAPAVYQKAIGAPTNDAITLPPDPIQAMPTYDTALAAFEKLPSVRVLFDTGAGSSPTGTSAAGDPYPGFEQSFSRFPAPGTVARQWYFRKGGYLSPSAPSARHIDWYTSNANALPRHDYTGSTEGGGLWGDAAQWAWNWKQNPRGTALSYLTSPLRANTVVVGAGAVKLWVRSSTRDVDLLATVSEVSPDGHETFVQNGWIRASERKLSTDTNNIFKRNSTAVEPIPSMLASDVRPMPKGKFVKVVIPLYYEGHAYRKGTRIRVTIAAPNGTQPIWSFDDTRPKGGTSKVSIVFSPKLPSSLVLPVVSGVAVPTDQPPCPSLRNEPCRAYAPIVNRTSRY